MDSNQRGGHFLYEMTRWALLIPGLFLHARDRLDSISTAVIVAAVIYIRAWDRPYPSLGSFCKVSVLMWYVWRVEMRQIIINLWIEANKKHSLITCYHLCSCICFNDPNWLPWAIDADHPCPTPSPWSAPGLDIKHSCLSDCCRDAILSLTICHSAV